MGTWNQSNQWIGSQIAREKFPKTHLRSILSRWWFQTFFIFTLIWGYDPIWLTFFKWVETTNQLYLMSLFSWWHLHLFFIAIYCDETHGSWEVMSSPFATMWGTYRWSSVISIFWLCYAHDIDPWPTNTCYICICIYLHIYIYRFTCAYRGSPKPVAVGKLSISIFV